MTGATQPTQPGTLQNDLEIWMIEGPLCDRAVPGYTERAKDRLRRTSKPTLAAADAIRNLMRRAGKPLRPCAACQLAVVALCAAEEASA